MSVLMTLLGVVVIVLGGLSTAYGIIINEFSLGNTLLLIGAIGIVGGLLLIAIASAARQLRRIADILSDRVPPRAIREVREPAFPPARRAAAKARVADAAPAAATDRVEPTVPSVRAPEPKLDRPPIVEQPTSQPEQPQPGSAAAKAAVEGETTVLRASEPPPIAPAVAPALAAEDSTGASATHEPAAEATHVAETANVEPPKRPAPAEEHADATAATPGSAASPAPSAGLGTFDSIWPQRKRAAEPAAEKPEPAAEADRATEAETVPIAPAGEGEQAPAAADDSHATEQPAPHAVSILKSGVVDGMAYTLYSDGSIEAELPSGTIRFASIKELRQHLERAD